MNNTSRLKSRLLYLNRLRIWVSTRNARSAEVVFPLAAAAIFAFFAAWITSPVIATGSWYHSHDGMRLPYLIYHFTDAIKAGIWYPRWLPELMSGYGYPTFVFYQPGYFFFTLPFSLLLQPVAAAYASLFAALMLGAWGAYRLARYYNTPWVSVLFAVVFLFAPYLAKNIFTRGAYSEAYAMLMLPWSVYFALLLTDAVRAGKNPWLALAGFVGVTAFITVTHPYVALFFLPFVGGLMVVRSLLPTRSFSSLSTCVCALALVMILTSPYWLTLFQLKDMVRYAPAISGPYDPLNQGADLSRVFRLNPLTPWFWFMLLAFAGFAVAWKNHAMRYGLVAYLVLAFLITDYATPVWEAGHALLKYVQFPWRIYAVLTTVAFFGMIQLGPYLTKLRAKCPEAGYALAAVSFAFLVYLSAGQFRLLVPIKELITPVVPQAMFWDVFADLRPLKKVNYYKNIRGREKEGGITMANTGEFTPRTAHLNDLPNRLVEPVPAVQMHDLYQEMGGIQVLPEATRYRIVADAIIFDRGAVVLNQFYFPGWRLWVDGMEVNWLMRDRREKLRMVGLPDTLAGDATYDDNGRMLVFLAKAGTYRIEAYYDGPPGWGLRNILIILLSATLIAVLYKLVAKARARA